MFLRFKLNQNHGGQKVSVVGSAPAIGSWVPQNSLTFENTADGMMTAQVEITDVADVRDIQYKYTLNHGDHRKIEWENGENRRINLEKFYN